MVPIPIEYGFELIGIVSRGEALDGKDLVDVAAGVATLDMNEQMNRVGDIGFDRPVRQLNSALQDTIGKPRKRLGGGIGVNGGKTAAVAGIERLQEIECFFPANLSQDR